jgi:hypothetical protein
MRSLLVLVLLAALAGGAFLSRPNADAQRRNAEQVLEDQRKQGKGDAIGDLIGAVLGGGKSDQFEDLMVATKYTVKEGDKTRLECWGVFSQFFCSSPEEK